MRSMYLLAVLAPLMVHSISVLASEPVLTGFWKPIFPGEVMTVIITRQKNGTYRAHIDNHQYRQCVGQTVVIGNLNGNNEIAGTAYPIEKTGLGEDVGCRIRLHLNQKGNLIVNQGTGCQMLHGVGCEFYGELRRAN